VESGAARTAAQLEFLVALQPDAYELILDLRMAVRFEPANQVKHLDAAHGEVIAACRAG